METKLWQIYGLVEEVTDNPNISVGGIEFSDEDSNNSDE